MYPELFVLEEEQTEVRRMCFLFHKRKFWKRINTLELNLDTEFKVIVYLVLLSRPG